MTITYDRPEHLYNIWSIPTWNMTYISFGLKTPSFDTSNHSQGLKWAHASYSFLYGASTCKSLYTEVYTSLSGGAWKSGSSHPDQGLHFTASGILEHYLYWTENMCIALTSCPRVWKLNMQAMCFLSRSHTTTWWMCVVFVKCHCFRLLGHYLDKHEASSWKW